MRPRKETALAIALGLVLAWRAAAGLASEWERASSVPLARRAQALRLDERARIRRTLRSDARVWSVLDATVAPTGTVLVRTRVAGRKQAALAEAWLGEGELARAGIAASAAQAVAWAAAEAVADLEARLYTRLGPLLYPRRVAEVDLVPSDWAPSEADRARGVYVLDLRADPDFPLAGSLELLESAEGFRLWGLEERSP